MNVTYSWSLTSIVLVGFSLACKPSNNSGRSSSSENGPSVVGYPVSHPVATSLSCTGPVSNSINSGIYDQLGLKEGVSVFYQMLSDDKTTITQLAKVSNSTESFQVGHQYPFSTPSAATVWFDMLGLSNGGKWVFSQDAKRNVTFSYSDSDLTVAAEVGYCQAGLSVDVDSTTDLFSVSGSALELTNSQSVRVGSRTIPGGLQKETTYYVLSEGSGKFRLAATKDSSQSIDITSNGSAVAIYLWNE